MARHEGAGAAVDRSLGVTTRWLSVAALFLAAACGGEPSRSPTCGLALVAGPTLVQERLRNPRAVMVEAPPGLPGRLPARVAGFGDQGSVLVATTGPRLSLGYEGAHFPVLPGYALLVVDDSSNHALGVLIYDREGPESFPRLGSVQGGTALELPLYGVRVDWHSVSNPHCPLLGTPTPEGT